MINKIFFDVDETLIHSCDTLHTQFSRPAENHYEDYVTAVRKGTPEVLDLARELVGHENVYLLSVGTRPYIFALNEGFGWGFDQGNIFARDYFNHGRLEGLSDQNNVLIDNLPAIHNDRKVCFVGIHQNWQDRYFQVRDFYGVDEGQRYDFFGEVKKFLTSRHYSDSFDS